MATKETIKAHAKEMTAPHKRAEDPRRLTNSKIDYSAIGHSDPIAEQVELEELRGGTAIDNTGRGVLRVRNPLFEINDKYETAAEKESEERWTNGGLTHEEEAQIEFFTETNREIEDAFEERMSYWESTYGENSQLGMGETTYGRDGKSYVSIYDKETGEELFKDNGVSCVNSNAAVLGGTVGEDYISTLAAKGDALNDDLIDPAQQYNINYKVDADGNVTERTEAEKQIQTTLTRMDNEATKLPLQLNMIDRIIADVSRQTPAANDATFTSATAPAISTSVSPTTSFNASAAPPAAEQQASPEAAPDKTPSAEPVAANDATFRVNGTSGPSASL